MKKLLLLGCTTLLVSCIWAQEKKLVPDPHPAMNMQQYWDSLKKKNEALLNAPVDLFKNKKTGLTTDNPGLTFISPAFINKNMMPVLAPDSDYVYNMPGTHAFDKSKAKGGAIFVTGKVEKTSAIIDKKK
jgi:hypothetical protein